MTGLLACCDPHQRHIQMATTVVGELPTALDRLAAPCRSCAPNLEPTKTRLVPLWAWLPLQEDSKSIAIFCGTCDRVPRKTQCRTPPPTMPEADSRLECEIALPLIATPNRPDVQLCELTLIRRAIHRHVELFRWRDGSSCGDLLRTEHLFLRRIDICAWWAGRQKPLFVVGVAVHLGRVHAEIQPSPWSRAALDGTPLPLARLSTHTLTSPLANLTLLSHVRTLHGIPAGDPSPSMLTDADHFHCQRCWQIDRVAGSDRMMVLTTTELTSVGLPLRFAWRTPRCSNSNRKLFPFALEAPQPRTSILTIRLRNPRASWVVAALTSWMLPPRGLHAAVLLPEENSSLKPMSSLR